MIYNVEDLIDYCEKDLLDSDDQRKYRILTNENGLSDESILQIEREIGYLPEKYRKCLSSYNLFKKVVGYFSLSPFDNSYKNMIDCLITENSDCSGLPISRNFIKENNVVFIGTTSDYTIYVARESSYFKEDQIILIDDEIIGNETNPRSEDIQIVADNVEQFLLIIGNLNQLHREVNDDDSNYDEKRSEFVERLKILNVNEKYYDIWKMLF